MFSTKPLWLVTCLLVSCTAGCNSSGKKYVLDNFSAYTCELHGKSQDSVDALKIPIQQLGMKMTVGPLDLGGPGEMIVISGQGIIITVVFKSDQNRLELSAATDGRPSDFKKFVAFSVMNVIANRNCTKGKYTELRLSAGL